MGQREELETYSWHRGVGFVDAWEDSALSTALRFHWRRNLGSGGEGSEDTILSCQSGWTDALFHHHLLALRGLEANLADTGSTKGRYMDRGWHWVCMARRGARFKGRWWWRPQRPLFVPGQAMRQRNNEQHEHLQGLHQGSLRT